MLFDLANTTTIPILPYLALGLLTMAEGPIATLMGAAASSSGLILPIPAYFSIVVGNLLSDMGWYGLGRFGKIDWLKRLGTKVGISNGRLDKVQANIQQHAPRLMFFAKLTVGFPIPTLVATGLSRVPLRRWAGFWVLGELIKSAILVSLGYYFTQAIQKASTGIQIGLWGVTALILVCGILWLKKHDKGV